MRVVYVLVSGHVLVIPRRYDGKGFGRLGVPPFQDDVEGDSAILLQLQEGGFGLPPVHVDAQEVDEGAELGDVEGGLHFFVRLVELFAQDLRGEGGSAGFRDAERPMTAKAAPRKQTQQPTTMFMVRRWLISKDPTRT